MGLKEVNVKVPTWFCELCGLEVIQTNYNPDDPRHISLGFVYGQWAYHYEHVAQKLNGLPLDDGKPKDNGK